MELLGVASGLPEPGPQVSLTVSEYAPHGAGNGDKPSLEIRHQPGDIADGTKVFIVDDDGDRITWADVWTTGPKVGPGSLAHIDGCWSDDALDRITEDGQVYRVIFESEKGETLAIREVAVHAPPDPHPC